MEIEYIIVIIVLLIVLLFNTYRISCLEEELKRGAVEGFANTDIANEALGNIAAIYNKGEMTVTNLKVTGNLDVTGNSIVGGTSTLKNTNVAGTLGVTGNSTVSGKMTAGSGKLGSYEIRGDRIGIPGRADIQIGGDKWCRLFDYNGKAYAGTAGKVGGFAGKNLWCNEGTLWMSKIEGKTPVLRGDSVKIMYGGKYLSACGDGDNSKCSSQPWWGSWHNSSRNVSIV